MIIPSHQYLDIKIFSTRKNNWAKYQHLVVPTLTFSISLQVPYIVSLLVLFLIHPLKGFLTVLRNPRRP